MKKIRLLIISLLCILTAFACSISVSAEAIEYYLEDLGMSISISDSMNVKVKGPESDLPKEKYLEATSADKNLTFTISMETSEDTKKITSLADQPTDVIDEIKSTFVSGGLSEGKDETYGDALFLNFTQEEENISARYSVTYINGMAITIVSQAKNNTFSNDDLALIKGSLESIRFDSIEQIKQENTENAIKIWIIVIISILLTAGAVIFIVSLVKKNKARKSFESHSRKKADYDVFKSHTPSTQNKQIGGYKTSTDYFDNHFDKAPVRKKEPHPHTPNNQQKKTSAVTRMGYFAKNLQKELKKSNSANNKAKRHGAKGKAKRTAVDYDIFSGK